MGKQLAPESTATSLPSGGNVSVSGCGEPIPPSTPLGGVAQTRRALACQARSRRFESGRPRSWWPWCRGSIRGCDPRSAGSSPAGHPSTSRGR
jgi:hypothetical protein